MAATEEDLIYLTRRLVVQTPWLLSNACVLEEIADSVAGIQN
jgi:hypothetical protein